jgi:hypothetical protein
MSETRHGGRHTLRVLLLIPALVMMARAARRHRMMWEYGSGPEARWAGPHGHHGWVGRGEVRGETTSGLRLPPKIESMLNSWHDRAHQAADSAESTTV